MRTLHGNDGTPLRSSSVARPSSAWCRVLFDHVTWIDPIVFLTVLFRHSQPSFTLHPFGGRMSFSFNQVHVGSSGRSCPYRYDKRMKFAPNKGYHTWVPMPTSDRRVFLCYRQFSLSLEIIFQWFVDAFRSRPDILNFINLSRVALGRQVEATSKHKYRSLYTNLLSESGLKANMWPSSISSRSNCSCTSFVANAQVLLVGSVYQNYGATASFEFSSVKKHFSHEITCDYHLLGDGGHRTTEPNAL